jgi:hypothetical protein
MSKENAGELTAADLRDCATDIVNRLEEVGDPFAGDDWSMMQVARAYLAEHPADEDEPVTAEWLQSMGWAEFGLGIASQRGLFRSRLRFAFDLGVTLCMPGIESEGHQMTRGELRRLCAALGVPLGEVAQ